MVKGQGIENKCFFAFEMNEIAYTYLILIEALK